MLFALIHSFNDAGTGNGKLRELERNAHTHIHIQQQLPVYFPWIKIEAFIRRSLSLSLDCTHVGALSSTFMLFKCCGDISSTRNSQHTEIHCKIQFYFFRPFMFAFLRTLSTSNPIHFATSRNEKKKKQKKKREKI